MLDKPVTILATEPPWHFRPDTVVEKVVSAVLLEVGHWRTP
jgi:hypothetical protein